MHSVNAGPFESPASVIERILDSYEGKTMESPHEDEGSTRTISEKLDVVFYPSSEEKFKSLLLANKVAWVLLHKTDGSTEIKPWNAQRLSSASSVLGNLRSGHLRGWKKKGICKAEVAINKQDIVR